MISVSLGLSFVLILSLIIIIRSRFLLALRSRLHLPSPQSSPRFLSMTNQQRDTSTTVSHVSKPGDSIAGLNRAEFCKSIELLSVRIPAKHTTLFITTLKPLVFSRPGMKKVYKPESNEEKEEKRIILLHEGVIEANLSTAQKSFVQENGGSLEMFELKLTYEHFNVEEVLSKLLPDNVEVPSSYEQAGHVAHVNIRDELLAYKYVVGQVILDKNYPQVKTVVNKVGQIENEFRTFPMEVLAGEDNLDVSLKESDAKFQFNFREVYWNSRLQMEHRRLIALLKESLIELSVGDTTALKSLVVADLMAGVGPFAVPLALCNRKHSTSQKKNKKKSKNDSVENKFDKSTETAATNKQMIVVHANDLNPMSFEAMINNKKINHISGEYLHLYNQCGRAFIQGLVTDNEGSTWPHECIMNLPQNATDFLDAFIGLGTRHLTARYGPSYDLVREQQLIMPRLHVYAFSTANEPVVDVAERAASTMQCTLADMGQLLKSGEEGGAVTVIGSSNIIRAVTNKEGLYSGIIVRDVAPKKVMICLSFHLPRTVAFARVSEERESKRMKT